MRATELRIGNLVLLKEIAYSTVTGIFHDAIQFERLDNWSGQCIISEVKPIPLTEEWLEKLGFKKEEINYTIPYEDSEGYKYKHSVQLYEDEWIYSNDGSDAGCYTLEADITYIHQLQNIHFALTSEELVLK